jgi:UDP:flavonoid glycosyltransferase YjiC (YdhE family)
LARILITTFGSLGDLFPYLAIGTELVRRGHTITVATSGVHRTAIESEGLHFHPVRPDIDHNNTELIAYVMDARLGSERIVRYLASLVRESYQDTLEAARHTDAIVTHPITFASVLIAQQLHLPWISTVLAPISFLSAYDPPVPAQAPWLHGLRVLGPRFMKWFWDNGRRHTLQWLKPVVDFRRELVLPPGSHPLFDGSHSPYLVLALFSRELAAPQPDWPPNTVTTGFPFYDQGEAPPALERFLEGGQPPVVFTLGSSAVTAAGSFYVESLAAVERLGCRAVFLTGPYPQGLPEILPPKVLVVPYAPHGAVFPRGSAIVHQGGIGTTAQAMRSGLPELVVPFAHDQFDNAARVRNKGAAEVMSRTRYRSRTVAAFLKKLLNQPSYKTAASDLGRQIRKENGAATAAAAIEQCIKSPPA